MNPENITIKCIYSFIDYCIQQLKINLNVKLLSIKYQCEITKY